MNKIGFVGLGSMGAPIACRLLPGNQVQGTNRTKAKATALIEQGLTWRDTPREAAAGAQVVFSMVTDDAALAAITSGPDGILAGLWPGTIYVDMSTVSRLGYGHRDIAGLFRVLAQAAAAPAQAGEPASSAAGAGPKAA